MDGPIRGGRRAHRRFRGSHQFHRAVAGLVFSLVGAMQPECIDGDRWPYGIEPNRPTLKALVHHLHEQDFIRDIAPIEDFFVPI